MTLAELPQVLALSAREKLELVDEIWQSIGTSVEAMEVTQEEKNILDKRWDDFLKNPASALTVDQFRDKMSARRA